MISPQQSQWTFYGACQWKIARRAKEDKAMPVEDRSAGEGRYRAARCARETALAQKSWLTDQLIN